MSIFEGHTDAGQVLHPGFVDYDAAGKSYTVSGSGENRWFATDEFQFVWTKVSVAPDAMACDSVYRTRTVQKRHSCSFETGIHGHRLLSNVAKS